MMRRFMEGNEAIARGALRAGCDFYAGYPITPASSILTHVQDLFTESGGVAIQCEDEIASIGFCIGAAMSGRKVLTATSGPGMSLYSENIGLAIMGETPMVIVNVQRQGPATGSATKGAEGDVQFTRWGTSGGMPVIVLSPATVEEAYLLSYIAFNYAEKYRLPVFLLTSKELSMTRETVDLEKIGLPPLVQRKKIGSENPALPHYFEHPAEVPSIADFGGDSVVRFTTSTHGKDAYLTTDPGMIQEMIDHYEAKIMDNLEHISMVKKDYQENAETLVISYGVTSRSVKVAVKEAREQGRAVSSLVLQTLWPVPEQQIIDALSGIKKVVVPEMNMGQYVLEIQRLVSRDTQVAGIHRMNTELISPRDILTEGGLL